MVLVDLHGTDNGAVEVCARCFNAILYDSPRDYFEAEMETLHRMKNCDHDFEGCSGGVPEGVCSYCGMPEDSNPKDLIDSRAVGWESP
jgi:hypothetical protein